MKILLESLDEVLKREVRGKISPHSRDPMLRPFADISWQVRTALKEEIEREQ